MLGSFTSHAIVCLQKQAAIAAQAGPGLTSAGIRSSAEGLQAAECNPAITRLLTTSRSVAADGPSTTSSSTGPSRLPATKASQPFGPAQFAAANRTAAVASTSGAPSNTAPPFPKLLGFAGAIPFVTLAPAMVEALGQPDLVEKCAQAQLFYGGSIVSFLGAVHWGMAMGSTLCGCP